MYKIRSILAIFVFLAAPLMSFETPIVHSKDDQIKTRMIRELEIIKNVFEVKYAPAEWKKKYSGWDLEEKIAEAKAQILSTDNITIRNFRKIVKNFFDSMSDYHVGVSFYSTSSAFLPFYVQGAENKIFVTWVDNKLSPNLSVGDEITEFNDKPVQETINSLKKSGLENSESKTEQALAEMFLTVRIGGLGHELPTAKFANVTFKKKGTNSIQKCKVSWDFQKEEISDGPFNSTSRSLSRNMLSKNQKVQSTSLADAIFYKDMSPSFYQVYHQTLCGRGKIMKADSDSYPDRLGTRNSVLPLLGKVLWKSAEDNPFQAYLYKNSSNQKIAYIRIPSYMPEEDDAKKFAEIINFLEPKSDALIIDQLNNPGGSVLYLYALASMLTNQPLIVPSQRVTITQEDVNGAIKILKDLELPESDIFKELLDVEQEDIQGFIVTSDFIESLKSYFRSIIAQWDLGNVFTDSNYLFGIETLQPHPWGYYSKPLLMLVNQLDFSGGDFLPAILQDNKRAVIMGTQTAGAGGFVLAQSHPSLFGIGQYTFTGSLAERLDKSPIENLGVSPDISYNLTVRDLQEGYVDYKVAIQKALDQLLKNREKPQNSGL